MDIYELPESRKTLASIFHDFIKILDIKKYISRYIQIQMKRQHVKSSWPDDEFIVSI